MKYNKLTGNKLLDEYWSWLDDSKIIPSVLIKLEGKACKQKITKFRKYKTLSQLLSKSAFNTHSYRNFIIGFYAGSWLLINAKWVNLSDKEIAICQELYYLWYGRTYSL